MIKSEDKGRYFVMGSNKDSEELKQESLSFESLADANDFMEKMLKRYNNQYFAVIRIEDIDIR